MDFLLYVNEYIVFKNVGLKDIIVFICLYLSQETWVNRWEVALCGSEEQLRLIKEYYI